MKTRAESSGSQTLLPIKITWGASKNPTARLLPLPIKPESPGMGPEHQYFFETPQVILICNQIESQRLRGTSSFPCSQSGRSWEARRRPG